MARSCGFTTGEPSMSPSPDAGIAAPRRDPLTKEQRSSTMRRIRRVDTGPEMALRRELSRRGFRYRVDYPRAPGRPDVAMVGRRIAVFVDGEFWHGRKLSAERLAEMPDYWQRKIKRNVARDARVNAELLDRGWTVIRITDRAINRDLPCIADFVERVASARPPDSMPAGVEIHQAQP